MKFLSLNKSQGYIFTTLLGLVFLGFCYFFIYLPNNEKRVEEQRFRTLQNIDRNIHQKIYNTVSLLNNLLIAYAKNPAYVRSYITNYPPDRFVVSPVTTIDPKGISRDSIDSAPSLLMNDATKQITVVVTKKAVIGNKPVIIQGSVRYSFRQFIEYLLPESVFDEYLVFSKGNVMFESFPSGISSTREDSLLNIKNGIGGSYIKNITAGGKDYKLFLQAVTFDSSNKWVLGGMLSKHRYQKERSQLPAGIIMLMVTVVLSIIVIFPWIKLYMMGSKDRLTLVDGASGIVVSILLMSMLFFCFFKYNTPVRSNGSPDSKRTLTEKITRAFYDETAKYYYILKSYDSLRTKNNITRDIVYMQKPGIAYTDGQSPIDNNIKTAINRFNDTASIRQFFWMDSAGNELCNWTSEMQNAPHNYFKGRNYYKNIVENKAYYLNGDDTKKFFLDQVVSWTSGTFTSVLSAPADNGKKEIAAISFVMKSVQDIVLPTGYLFAIIDNNGKVLYHSLKSRNLNENIKSEFSDSTKVVSCIDARSEGEFTTSYYSKSYAVRISPMKDLPYFIIIFSDTSYKEIRDVEIYSFTFSTVVLLFLYMVLQLSVTFLVSSKRSFFKKQLFDTSWIGPKISRHKEYIISSALNIMIIILLIIFFQKMTFLQYVFMVLFAVTCISLFLNVLLLKRYKKEGEKNYSRLKTYAVVWLSLLLVIINITAFNLLEPGNFIQVFLVELVALAAADILIGAAEVLPENVRNALSDKWNYTHSFSLMALTGLIITSGIPVAFFYITSYNYEQNLQIRHRQTDYANRLLQQPGLQLHNDSIKNFTYDTAGIYYDRTWISTMPTVTSLDTIDILDSTNIKATEIDENIITRKILGTFRLALSDKAVKTDKLYIPYASDTSIVYQPLQINTHTDSSVSTYRKTGVSNTYLKLSSFKLNYVIPTLISSAKSFLYWILLLLALLIFYFIIRNIVKKLFCLNLPDLEIWKYLDDKILTDNNLNKLLFIIGLPGAGKLDKLGKKITDNEIMDGDKFFVYDSGKAKKDNVLVADLINIPDKGTEIEKDADWIAFTQKVLNPKYRLVILNHFEYNIQDEFSNSAKLNLLEQLMLKHSCKIIILSTIHPVAFLDSINENAKKADEKSNNVHDLERWHVLLGHYRIAIMPITKEKKTYNPPWHELLGSETSYTHFLSDMQQVTLDIAKTITEDEADVQTDELAYKLQVTAHYFYMYIWQSLTKEEKFLLYDLAEDNLVNSYDDYNLTMLIAKGVIIHSDGSLRFFNRGFRNFILTAIGNTEAMKIKDRIRENGNWSNLKTPLVIIILAILSFLLISQQEAYSKLLTYVAALSAGVPAVLKIFSFFDKTASKSNT